jgi:hydrogenase expression/formation protein HypC
MCLGVPGRVIEIDGMNATCDFWGITKVVRLDVIDEPVVPGDYLLNHVGYAIRRIPPEDIAETLTMYEELIGELRPGAPGAAKGDLMADDIRGELAAASSTRPTGG